MNPDRVDGIPVCSREKCADFIVRSAPSGWLGSNGCTIWNCDKYGKEYYFSLTKKTLCRPYIEEALISEYRNRLKEQEA